MAAVPVKRSIVKVSRMGMRAYSWCLMLTGRERGDEKERKGNGDANYE